MGVMIAPARGSGRCPAWMARVPKAASRSSSNTRVMPILLRVRSSGEANPPPRREGGDEAARCRATSAIQSMPVDSITAPYCLIVDDEPRLRQVLMHLMRGDGFHCVEAANGEE